MSSRKIVYLFCVAVLTIFLVPITAQAYEVDPLVVEFGDVAVGSSQTDIVTIQNLDTLSVTIVTLDLSGSADMAITDGPSLPLVLGLGASAAFEITFSPSAEGAASATLLGTTNESGALFFEVSLSGTGVSSEPPTSPSVADILAFFDESVANGTLVGAGPGNSADGRRNALRNKVEAAGDLIEGGNLAEGCAQLMNAYERTDGAPRPPDFVTGGAAPDLAAMILDAVAGLGCQ